MFRVAAHRLVLGASSSLLASLLGERGEGEAVLLVPSTPGWALSLLVTSLYGDTAIDTTAPGGARHHTRHRTQPNLVHFETSTHLTTENL